MRATKEQVQSHRYIPVLKPTELLNITFHYHAFFVSFLTHKGMEANLIIYHRLLNQINQIRSNISYTRATQRGIEATNSILQEVQ